MEENKVHFQPEWLKDEQKLREVIEYLSEIYNNLKTGEQGEKQKNKNKIAKYREERTRYHLMILGVQQNIKGYRYLEWILPKVSEKPDLIDLITKNIYPMIAKEFDTTPQKVERAIRHSIEAAWDRGDIEIQQKYFGNTISREKGKPTNGEFIANIGNLIKYETEDYQE